MHGDPDSPPPSPPFPLPALPFHNPLHPFLFSFLTLFYLQAYLIPILSPYSLPPSFPISFLPPSFSILTTSPFFLSYSALLSPPLQSPFLNPHPRLPPPPSPPPSPPLSLTQCHPRHRVPHKSNQRDRRASKLRKEFEAHTRPCFGASPDHVCSKRKTNMTTRAHSVSSCPHSVCVYVDAH